MHHSEGSKYGENLYAADNPKDIDLICEYACKAWYIESKKYNFNNGGFSAETGHFTQMVWKSSQRVGIGESGRAGGRFYIVGRYYPSGNVDGGFEKNVGPLQKIPMSCLLQLKVKWETIKRVGSRIGIKDAHKYFVNNSQPCDLMNTTTNESKKPQGGEVSQVNKGGEGALETQGGTGNLEAVSTQPILVAVPISEPVTAQHTPEIIVQPNPSEQHIPQPIVQVNGSPSSNVSSSQGSTPPAVTQRHKAMNPSQATKAQDFTPAKKENILKKLSTPKQ